MLNNLYILLYSSIDQSPVERFFVGFITAIIIGIFIWLKQRSADKKALKEELKQKDESIKQVQKDIALDAVNLIIAIVAVVMFIIFIITLAIN